MGRPFTAATQAPNISNSKLNATEKRESLQEEQPP